MVVNPNLNQRVNVISTPSAPKRNNSVQVYHGSFS